MFHENEEKEGEEDDDEDGEKVEEEVLEEGEAPPNTQCGWECEKNYFNNCIPDIHSDMLSKTCMINNRVSP